MEYEFPNGTKLSTREIEARVSGGPSDGMMVSFGWEATLQRGAEDRPELIYGLGLTEKEAVLDALALVIEPAGEL